MEKKGKNEIEKGRTLMRFVICVLLLATIWGSYFAVMKLLNRQIELCKDDFTWVYQVDSAELEGDSLVLHGFAFRLAADASAGSYELVLRELESGRYYFPKMKYMERPDVNNYFLCEYSYLESGFEAAIKTRKLDLQGKNYELLVRISGEKSAYQTGIYLVEGQLAYADPTEFEPLMVAGTDLERVVEQGILRVYRPDYGMYVYQYEGGLYWIAEQGYAFDENGDARIQFQLNTTQVDKLPKERVSNHWLWDNISFWFKENELTEWDVGNYRVAKKALPTEYAIEKVWTGNHDGEWIWKQNFRPWYDFDN